jgi:hypothetical protein
MKGLTYMETNSNQLSSLLYPWIVSNIELLIDDRCNKMRLFAPNTACTPRKQRPARNAGQAGQADLGFVRFVGESMPVQPAGYL